MKAVGLSVVSALLLLGGIAGEADPADDRLPEGVRGFSGQVRGVVAAKGKKDSISFKVGRVLRVWKNNKAKKPKALVGRTVRVGPRWEKNEKGKWHPVERHVAFIRKLKRGEEITLEIHNVERHQFAILELSREQRKRAEGEGTEKEGKEGREEEEDEEEDEEEEILLRALLKEIRALREEIAELRALFERKERSERRRKD